MIIEDNNIGFSFPKSQTAANHLTVSYEYLTNADAQEAAFLLCREQSTSTWNKLHNESIKIRKHRGAKLISCDTKEIVIAYPDINFDPYITDIFITILGNGTFLNNTIFRKLRIKSIQFPNSILNKIIGPAFGYDLSKLFNKKKRPIVIAVQKPSIGLSTKDHIERVIQAFEGGCEIVKEDEQFRPNDFDSKLDQRIRLLLNKLPKVISRLKEHRLYLINLASNFKLWEYVNAINEINDKFPKPIFGVMLSYVQGYSIIQSVCNNTSTPVFIHPSGMGIVTRGNFGISEQVYNLLLRLCGSDVIIYPSPFSKLAYSKQSINKILEVSNMELENIKETMFAFGCGVNKNVLEKMKRLIKGKYMVLMGGAIFSYPKGPFYGAKTIIEYLDELYN